MGPNSESRNDRRDAQQPPAPARGAAGTARVVAVHLAHLLWPAAVYLGATALDLIYAARLGLLMRSRAKSPDRAGDLDAQMARLREQRSTRWSSWKALPGGRRMEIRFAASILAVAAILGLRAYLTRGESSVERVAHLPTRAHDTSAMPPRSDASIPSTISAADQALLDAKHFTENRKQAAPGQWIVFGFEQSVESARAHLAEVQARTKTEIASLPPPSHTDAAFNRRRLDQMSALRSAEAEAQAALNRARHPVVRPVLTRGEVEQWDGYTVTSPVVIKDGNRYRMWYVGCHFVDEDYTCGVGHAQSSDGITWEKSPGPVLTIEDAAVSQDLHSIAVVRAGNEYLLWYAFYSNPLHGNDCSTLNLATSSDGLAWKPQGLVLRANCGENAGHLWQSAFYDGKTIHLWYSGYDDSGYGSLMHLVSADGKNWQKTGSTYIPTLGMSPKRLWVMPDPAGYRALFAVPGQKGYFGMLQSPDGNNWTISGDAPTPVEPGAFGNRAPEAPVAIVESGGTWMWFAVLDTEDNSEEITMAFQKGAQR